MENKRKWIICISCLVLFALATILVLVKQTALMDDMVYDYLISFKSPGVTSYCKFMTFWANTLTLIVLSALALIPIIFKNRTGIYLVSMLVITVIVNQSFKYLVARARPEGISLIIETGHSFPSGHSMAAVSFYGFIIWLLQKSSLNTKLKWITTGLLTFLIINVCLSRVYLGVHYFSDVLAGALLSLSLLIIVTHVLKGKGWGV